MFHNLYILDFEKTQSGNKLQIPRRNFLDLGGENFNRSVNINIVETVSMLTRCSFDQRYREPIILLGGIEALAELIKVIFMINFLELKWGYYLNAKSDIY